MADTSLEQVHNTRDMQNKNPSLSHADDNMFDIPDIFIEKKENDYTPSQEIGGNQTPPQYEDNPPPPLTDHHYQEVPFLDGPPPEDYPPFYNGDIDDLSYGHDIPPAFFEEEPEHSLSAEEFAEKVAEQLSDAEYQKIINDEAWHHQSLRDEVPDIEYDEFGNIIRPIEDDENTTTNISLEHFEEMHREFNRLDEDSLYKENTNNVREVSWNEASDTLKKETLEAISAAFKEYAERQESIDSLPIFDDMLSYLKPSDEGMIVDFNEAPEYIHHILDIAEESQKGTQYPREVIHLYAALGEALQNLPVKDGEHSEKDKALIQTVLSYPVSVKDCDRFFLLREKEHQKLQNQEALSERMARWKKEEPSDHPQNIPEKTPQAEHKAAAQKHSNGSYEPRKPPENQTAKPFSKTASRENLERLEKQPQSFVKRAEQTVSQGQSSYRVSDGNRSAIFLPEDPDILPTSSYQRSNMELMRKIEETKDRAAVQSFNSFLNNKRNAQNALSEKDIPAFKKAYEEMLYNGRSYLSSRSRVSDKNRAKEAENNTQIIQDGLHEIKEHANNVGGKEIETFLSSDAIKALEEKIKKLIELVKQAIARIFNAIVPKSESSPSTPSPTP